MLFRQNNYTLEIGYSDQQMKIDSSIKIDEPIRFKTENVYGPKRVEEF